MIEESRSLKTLDRVTWQWFVGQAALNLKGKQLVTFLSPPRISKVWAWVFAKGQDDKYVRAGRMLNALRNRSRAYRRIGQDRSAEAALRDLAELMEAS